MPLSVNVRLEVVNVDIRPENPDLKIHIRSDGMTGVAYTDWNTFVHGQEVTGIIDPPAGQGLRPSRKRMKRASMKQEEEFAGELGGHRQSGSGSRRGNKGDGQVLDQAAVDALEGAPGRYRTENKFSTCASMTLHLVDLQKIRSECRGREVPVFNVQFKDRATLRTLDDWVLIPRKEWKALASKTDDHS